MKDNIRTEIASGTR